MPIQFPCSCGRTLQAQDEHVGRRVRCPSCGTEMTVPGAEDAVQAAPPVNPKLSPIQAEPRRASDEEADADRPRRRSREDDEEDDDRPRRRAREDDEDDYDRPRMPTATSGKATAALVLGLLSFCLNACAGVPAIILAVMALGNIKQSRGRLGGQGLAIAGLVLACLGMASGVPLLIGLLVPAVQKTREAATRMQCSNNMKQMALGIMNDADSHNGQMVAHAIYDKNGKPLLSWRVALLPYIEQDMLYRQFRLDEPWDGPNNKPLLGLMPRTYAHPADPDGAAKGLTCFRVFTGPHTAFPDPLPPFPRDHSACHLPMSFTDGTSNSILIVEAAETVPWTKPDKLPYDPNKPLPKLGGRFANGYLVGLADGSVKFITPSTSEQTVRTAITIDDGLPLGPDWPLH